MTYDLVVNQPKKMLQNLKMILGKAVHAAEARKYAPEVLLQTRLFPDQFPLVRQIQIVCDTAKLTASRLTGKDAPMHEDNETTVPQLIARIDSVTSYLSQFTAKDFEGSSERKVSQPRWEGKYLNGSEFLVQHALPNLYFHTTTAYSILRHCGVEVGKKDYLGEMPFKK